MSYFQQPFKKINYFAGQQPAGDRGFVAFIIPGDPVDLPGLDLPDALTNTTYAGVFVFSAVTPQITNSNVQQFITEVLAIADGSRAFIWLNDPNNPSVSANNIIYISADGSSVSPAAIVNLATGLVLNVQNGMSLSLNDTVLSFDGSSNATTMGLGGSQSLLQSLQASLGTLNFAGPTKGVINFITYIYITSLHDYLQWGFQILYPAGNGYGNGIWQPFATATPAGDSIGFSVYIDPSDVYNHAFDPCENAACTIVDAYRSRRTYLNFTGQNTSGASTLLNANYSSTFGAPVNLQPVLQAGANALPARFVISPSNNNDIKSTNFIFTPEGDFVIQIPSVTNAINNNLLCGVNATEFFTVTPQSNTYDGDILRLISQKPGYAPLFPFTGSGGNASSIDATKLLDNTFTTAWATIISTSANINYISQPHGASLFGKNQDVIKTSDTNPVLGFYPSSIMLSDSNTSISAPFIPYGEIQPADVATCQLLEQQIVSPVRKAFLVQDVQIAAKKTKATAAKKGKAKSKKALSSTDDGPHELPQDTIVQTTSPQGLYINVDKDQDNKWTLLQLAANTVKELVDGKWVTKDYLMNFTNLTPVFQSAFQTNQLFLVMSAPDAQTAASFTGNEMSIEGWPFIFNLPTSNPNGIFNNVLIFKFIKDAALKDLVNKPQQWAMTAQFNYTPDNPSLNNLTTWLSGYISSACDRFKVNGDTDYEKFYNIATNPAWQGIIGLNVSIDLGDFPEQLQGLLAGIDLTRFSAHHFGIDLNNVEYRNGDLVMNKNSSLFGLIDYEDVVFQSFNYSITEYQQNAPINTSVDYEFRVLSLKVLFENSKITNFGSYLALTINKLFGEKVKSDNMQNRVIFQGNYEDHNGEAVYTFSSIPASGQSGSDYMLFLDSVIINDVEISGSTFNTLVSQNAQDNIVHSVFALNGFINFYPLTGFDLLSYGCEPDFVKAPTPGQGLSFTNMNVNFSFPLATPQATTFAFDITQMSFDGVQSYSRQNSLVTNFPIQITGIVSSETSPTPASQGYLNVQLPSLQQKQPPGPKWYGLQYNLNMGTLGALTGALGFNTVFMALWTVGATGAAAAIRLPGVNPQAPFFSLQGVLKINIGGIQLVLADGSQSAYLMKINNIALKLLSLSFPPGGNVNFFLFGNPNGADAPQSVGWYTGYLASK